MSEQLSGKPHSLEEEDSFRDYDLVLSASATGGLLGADCAHVFASSLRHRQGDLHGGLISSRLGTNGNSIRCPSRTSIKNQNTCNNRTD